MDSITQITLGAAIGEAVLGRRVGNRAMLWGGIAGTLPDLDVLANVVTDGMSALAYHRAFTHSFIFAALAAPLFGWLVHRLYGGQRGPLNAWPFGWIALLVGVLFFILLFTGSSLMPVEIYNVPLIAALITLVAGLPVSVLYLRERLWRKRPDTDPNPNWWAWTHLFFWAIITHPLLDCCTTYGTQIFEPLSDVRIGWNNISVVDPLYTIPFLLFLLIASRFKRRRAGRRYFMRLALGLSTVYLLLTLINKFSVDGVMEHSIRVQSLPTSRYTTSPTLLNNILWQGTAETRDSFYYGRYSLLDRQPVFHLRGLPKNHELLAGYQDERDVRILQWFTNGYYNVLRLSDDTLQLNDLRFGSLGETMESNDSYIFSWKLIDKGGRLEITEAEPGGGGDRDWRALLSSLWERIKGVRSEE